MQKVLLILFSLFLMGMAIQASAFVDQAQKIALNNNVEKLNQEIKVLQAQIVQDEQLNKTLLLSHQQDLALIVQMKKNMEDFVRSNTSLYASMLEQIKLLRMRTQGITPWHLSFIVQQFSSNLFLNLSFFNTSERQSSILSAVSAFNQSIMDVITEISQRLEIPSQLVVVDFLLLILLFILLPISIKSRYKSSVASQKKEKPHGATRLEKKPEEDISQTANQTPNYQFLSGENVEASKLDLGSALLEMGNYVKAKQVLESVLPSGNEQQKAEAEQLLKKVAEQNK